MSLPANMFPALARPLKETVPDKQVLAYAQAMGQLEGSIASISYSASILDQLGLIGADEKKVIDGACYDLRELIMAIDAKVRK